MDDDQEVTDYTTLKIGQLKELLRDRGLNINGRKDELIQRLEESDHAPKADDQQSSKRSLRDRSALKKTEQFVFPEEKKKEKVVHTKRQISNDISEAVPSKKMQKQEEEIDSKNTGTISTDVWKLLLVRCDPKSVCTIACCSKIMNKLASTNDVWRPQYAKLWTIGYGENWNSNFTDPALHIDGKANTGWKARFLHRLRLQPIRKDYKALKELCNNESVEYVGEFLQPAEDDENYDEEAKYVEVYTDRLESDNPFTIIGPSTIPVRFKTEYRDHTGESVWFFRASVYSYKSKRWKVVYEIKANYKCDEDEAYTYTLYNTVGRLIYGVKSSEPFEYPISHNLEVLLKAFSGADNDQIHDNTGSFKERSDADDEIYA